MQVKFAAAFFGRSVQMHRSELAKPRNGAFAFCQQSAPSYKLLIAWSPVNGMKVVLIFLPACGLSDLIIFIAKIVEFRAQKVARSLCARNGVEPS